MKKQLFFFLSAIFISCIVQSQEVITSWNFDNGLQFPAVGSGTLSLAGSIIVDFTKTGINPGGSLPAGKDEKELPFVGKSCNTYNYPAQGTNPKSAGLQLKVSTAGYKNIIISADVRQGGTSANKLMMQYTVDGITWEKATTYTTDKNDSWYLRNYNFKNIPAVENNPNFAFRFVTNFDDDVIGQLVYVPVTALSAYSPTGSVRYDNIIVRGDKLSVVEDDRTTFVEWNFTNKQLTPVVGQGTLETIGGVSYDTAWTKTGILTNQTIFDQGVYDYSSIKDSFGLQTLNYPAVGNSKSAGIELFVNSANYKDLVFSADVRHSGTSANTMTLQYSTDGSTWIDATTYTANSGDTWYLRKFDFSSIPATFNTHLLGLRMVTALAGLSYMPTTAGKTYATTGTIRFDNIVLKGRILSALAKNDDATTFVQRGKILDFTDSTGPVKIYSLSGIQFFETQGTGIIDLNHLPDGVYILVVNHIRTKLILK